MTLTDLNPATDLLAPDDWPVLRALSADASQRIFRSCLTALSRPGLIGHLPQDVLPPGVPAVVAPPLALTDLMAPLTGLETEDRPGAARAAEIIARTTGARITDAGNARFALAFSETDQLAGLSVGSTWSPEFGALLCQRVDALSDHDHQTGQTLCLRLTGPGIKISTDICIDGLSARFVELRHQLTKDFPRGVDVLLISDDGTVAGLPRTTRIEVL